MAFLSVNPIFLFILFSMGYVFGLLLRNPSAGKFVIFGFFGVFIYEPVKDAGLLASAIFVLGIIIHHISLLSLFDSYQLYRIARSARDHYDNPRHDAPEDDLGPQGRGETEDETHRKFEEWANRQRKKKAQQKEQHSGSQDNQTDNTKKKRSSGKHQNSKAQDDLKRQQEAFKQKQAEFEKQKRAFDQEKNAQTNPTDNRSPEEILGLKAGFTKEELKKAWRSEAARWHPDQLRNKPPHLVKQAEEELKRINGAYERLKGRSN
jgi:hypothetical protein